MAPMKSSLSRSVSKLLGVFKDSDLSLRGNVQSLRTIPPFEASGGTKTTAGDYIYHDLANGDTFNVLSGRTNEGKLLLIGGGGGGAYGPPGNGGQAGGGAGGVIIAPAVTLDSPITVTVGAGGADGPGQGNDGGEKGGNSTFGPNWVALGGGGGASAQASAAVGSGGGLYGGTANAYTQSDDPTIPSDSRTYGYGNDGGAGSGPNNYGGGGGGGAGGAGTDAPTGSTPAAVGGAGLPTAPIPWLSGTPFFSPTSQFFAGGGGGVGRDNTSSSGGSGGGGAANHSSSGGNGTDGTGSGGGGGHPEGGDGGNGRCIVVYPTSARSF